MNLPLVGSKLYVSSSGEHRVQIKYVCSCQIDNENHLHLIAILSRIKFI